MTFRRRALAATASCILGWSAAPATAGEGLFSRAYTTDTTPKGTFEFEQVVREREGRAFGHYDSTDFRTELEYGVTDKFQAALYLNSVRTHATGAPDDDDDNGTTGFTRHNFGVQSVSGEFIYRFFSPYETRNGWGLAVYFEPSIVRSPAWRRRASIARSSTLAETCAFSARTRRPSRYVRRSPPRHWRW